MRPYPRTGIDAHGECSGDGIPCTDSEALAAALTAAGFASSSTGPVTTFELERDGMVSTESATHLFTGDAWILSDGTGLAVSGPVAASALDAIRAANPTLGL